MGKLARCRLWQTREFIGLIAASLCASRRAVDMTIYSHFIFACVVLVLFVGAEWALFVKARNAGRHEVQAL